MKKYTKAAVKKANKAKKQRNLFRKTLYQSNRLIKLGDAQGYYKHSPKLTMKRFKQDFNDFKKAYPVIKNKRLSTQLQDFLDLMVKGTNMNSARSARKNFINNLRDAISNVNTLGKDHISEFDRDLFQLAKKRNYIIKLDNGKYRLDVSKVLTADDFYNVTNRYLSLKRELTELFGDQYGEAFGS